MKTQSTQLGLSLLALVLCVQCGPAVVSRKPVTELQNKTPPTSKEYKEVMQVRNFDQIYRTMAQLTEVHPSEVIAGSTSSKKIYEEFASIKSQLPSERDANSFSAFNQIASTRLAFFFCNNYIEKNTQLLSLGKVDYINYLIEHFVGESPTNFKDYSEVSAILDEILDEKTAVGYMPPNNSRDLKKRYKVGCSALLSSNYVLIMRSLL